MPLITVFTPTYNRARLLPRLYTSLCNQTCKDFEWIIVDDGSTDETEELVKAKFLNQGIKFTIRYYKKENGGKHRAINRGVEHAKGRLFFIVDSDDWLPKNSVELISKQYSFIKGRKGFGGLSGMRFYPTGNRIGGDLSFEVKECTAFDYWFKYDITGDSAEVYYTDVLRRFSFPEIPGEKFCPEALVWYRIAKAGYKLRYFNKPIYTCEYLPDGLSAKITEIRVKSPIASTLTYWELWDSNVRLKWRIRAGINCWRFWFHCQKDKRPKSKPNILLAVPGFLMYIKDKKQLRNG